MTNETKTNGQTSKPIPIWPVDDLDVWYQELKEFKSWATEQIKVTKVNEASKKVWAADKAVIKTEMQAIREKLVENRPGPKKGSKKTKKPSYVPTHEPRQLRLGQTKLIDDLMDKGLNDQEIFDGVRKEIPEYPEDKLPKLIKLRHYHKKKRDAK